MTLKELIECLNILRKHTGEDEFIKYNDGELGVWVDTKPSPKDHERLTELSWKFDSDCGIYSHKIHLRSRRDV